MFTFIRKFVFIIAYLPQKWQTFKRMQEQTFKNARKGKRRKGENYTKR